MTDSDSPDACDPAAGPAHEDTRPPKPRRWRFYLMTVVVAPALLLGLAEVGLRIAGYGYPTTFFVDSPNPDLYAANSHFGMRFFPRALSREPWPVYLAKTKPDGAYRIFILGGSAAMGQPDPAYGLGQVLKTMLAETYPQVTFEIAATAMVAINSHVVLPIARDCAKQDPDLFIIYLGNNEVVGPFGAGTVFQDSTPPLPMIRANLAVGTTKLGQLTKDLIERLAGGQGPEQWAGMEMFLDNLVAADDPKLQDVYRHFRRNLEDICQAGHKAGADTILCTVGVNLRHCPPFASQHKPGLTDAQLARWNDLFKAAVEAERIGDHPRAIEAYLQAAAIDDRFAELPFRLGRCYLALGHYHDARQAFIKARDLDALRFRADSNINRIIREVAAASQGLGVHLVDAEDALAAADKTPARLPGEAMFYEHVHMTFDGTYEVARAIFREVVKRLPETIRSTAAPSPAPPSRERCAELMDLTAWQQAQMLSTMLRLIERPPFTGQLDHAERHARMTERRRWFESRIPSSDGPTGR